MKRHSGEKSNDLVSIEGNGKETGNGGEELARQGHVVFISFADTKQHETGSLLFSFPSATQNNKAK